MLLVNHVSDAIRNLVDEDRVNPPPPSLEILQLEVDGFERAIKIMDQAGKKGEQTAMLWMEVATRKDKYRTASAKSYESTSDANRREKAALVATFTALQGFEWNRKFGWMGLLKSVAKPEVSLFEASASLFEGVETTKLMQFSLIKGVHLPGVGARGILPRQLGDLETLRTLNMSWNLIQGALPKEVGSLQSLETLQLAGNMLTGALDMDVLSELTNLKLLDLSNNELSGSIPDCFRGLTNLQHLNLSTNCLVGGIPPSLSNCIKLEVLKLQQNRLVGELSLSTFSTLGKLKDVNLSQNQFSGPGLASFGACTSLERLQLQDNELIGRFPGSSLKDLSRLQILYINKNKMGGVIPAEICSLTSLRRLNISSNSFRGILPKDIGHLVNLQTFLAQDNAIIGPLPKSLSLLERLRDFAVVKNYPSEHFAIPRGFTRNAFERIHAAGPALGLNNVTWDLEDLYGPTGTEPCEPFELFHRRLYVQAKDNKTSKM